jgi:polysaccharide pyruvyl transferase WcaK-like protein
MKKTIKILHIGIHKNIIANSGDKVHFYLLRKWFDESFFPTLIKWSLRQIWKKVTINDIEYINRNYDAVLIGGGGLFLKDQKNASNFSSGWQWNIKSDLINKINVPIVVFGVGFNKFRGQSDFRKEFISSVQALKRQSIFFGLRNLGSIKELQKLLVEKKNISLQPCVTSYISKLRYFKNLSINKNKKKIISFGFAYDRIDYRFFSKKKFYSFINLINDLIEILSTNHTIHFVYHKIQDRNYYKYINLNNRKKVKQIDLTNKNVSEIIKYYSKINLIYAMRGHNQLIALGLGTKFYSLISHNKINYLAVDLKLKKFKLDVSNLNESYKHNYYEHSKLGSKELKKLIKKGIKKNYLISKKNINFIKLKLLSFK